MDFLALSQECAPWVAPQTMAAIVKTESRFKPFSIGVNSGARLIRQPVNKAEAVTIARRLINTGHNIDLGLGQVNSANLKKVGLSIEDAFEPCKNVSASATILHGNFKAAKEKGMDNQAALHAALSAYNTGSFSKGFRNGYVQKVLNNFGAKIPSIPVQTVAPFPLAAKNETNSEIKIGAQSSEIVKLKAIRQSEFSPQISSTSVYSITTTNSAMVY